MLLAFKSGVRNKDIKPAQATFHFREIDQLSGAVCRAYDFLAKALVLDFKFNCLQYYVELLAILHILLKVLGNMISKTSKLKNFALYATFHS